MLTGSQGLVGVAKLGAGVGVRSEGLCLFSGTGGRPGEPRMASGDWPPAQFPFLLALLTLPEPHPPSIQGKCASGTPHTPSNCLEIREMCSLGSKRFSAPLPEPAFGRTGQDHTGPH